MKPFVQLFLAVILLAGAAGCGMKTKDEEAHPLFKRAVKAQQARETELAIEYFQRYLVVNPESSKTHLLLASIYDETLDKPLQAVYHYERFLEFAPKSPEAENVKKWLAAAKKKYYYRARLEYNDPEDVAALQDTLYTRSQELKKCRLELAKAESMQKKLLIYARQTHNNEKTLGSRLAELQAAHNKTLAEIVDLEAKIAEQEKKALAEKEKKEKEIEKPEKANKTGTEKTGDPGKDEKPELKKELKPQDKIPEDRKETGKETEKSQETAPVKTEAPVKETEKPEAKTAAGSPSPSPPKTEPAAPPFILQKVEKTADKAASDRTYIVQNGDSLSSIARQFYGSAKYYKIIFDANRDLLPTEKALRPGQILKIPARQD